MLILIILGKNRLSGDNPKCLALWRKMKNLNNIMRERGFIKHKKKIDVTTHPLSRSII